MRTEAVCIVVCDTGLLASFGGWVCETTLLSSFGGAWQHEPGLLAHVIHANVVLTVLSLDLPRHPRQRCARHVVVGLAMTSMSMLRPPCCRWACHFILGISASALGLLVVIGLCPGRGEGTGVSRSGERKCNHHIPHGSPTTWVSPCISITPRAR
jgi:hypothetical protein